MHTSISFILLTLASQHQWLGVFAKDFSIVPFARPQSLAIRQASVFDTRPAECPPCFDCNLDDFKCQQFGTCGASNGKCACPEGFGGDDCGVPLCGSPGNGTSRAPRPADQKYCQCSEGWEGINCNVCSNDRACDALMPEGKDGVCYQDGLVQKQNYQFCDVTNAQIVSMLDPRRPQVTFSCNAEDHTCDFQFWVEHQESFYCSLDTCAANFEISGDSNTTSYTCEHIQCRCVPGRFLCNEGGNLDLSNFIADSIKGPAIFKAVHNLNDKSQDKTSFSEPGLDGLINQVFGDQSIFLSCGGGECLYKTEVPGYEKPVKVANTSLIAGIISGCVLLTVVIGLVFAWLSRRRNSSERYGMVLAEDEDEASQALMEEHKPASLHFTDLSYRVAGKQILSDVQGAVHPGELLAIMGASGAGKTTFLDILAHKDKRGSSSGSIYVNGEIVSHDGFRLLRGFVDQEDTMLPTLTVHETILDSAFLRLPKGMSMAAKRQRVDEVERQLGIHHIRDSIIGSAESQRGISGGEKRRVSIACELVTSPSFLFLDEPTSGLDAFNAYNVVECLRTLAQTHNRTVIFTIHQPRSNIFALFDRLLLLAEGRTVYSGNASECQAYFESIGYSCPAGFNIADYLIDLTMDNDDNDNAIVQKKQLHSTRKSTETSRSDSPEGAEYDEASRDSSWLELSKRPKSAESSPPTTYTTDVPTEANTGRILDRLLSSYSKSKLAHNLQQEIEKASTDTNQEKSNNNNSRTNNKNKINMYQQFRILSVRTWRNLYRNPMLMLTHYTTSIILAILLGYLFFGLTDDISGFQNRMGILSFVLALFGFSTLTTLTVFAEERLLFVRERANGYYHPLAYFAAKFVFDMLPLRLFPPIMLSAVVYPMSGLVADWSHFLTFVVVLVLFNFAAASVCLFIGIVVKNPGTANLLGSLFMLFSLLFSGLFLNHETIPTAALWLQMLSIFHYAFEALLVNEVRYLTLIEHKFGLDIEVPGASILSSFGFQIQALWPDVGGLCVFVAVFVVLAYTAMHFLLVERR